MNCISSAVNVLRSKRICFFNYGSLFLILLLLTTQIACRPPDENEGNTAIDDDYAGVDNVEWHHVKIIDGVMHEDHPVIMYKEDFVNEDYVPNSKGKSNEQTSVKQQKNYKDIAIQRRQQQNNADNEENHTIKPEKIYFDVLPETPVVVADDSNANDSKFDPTKIRADLIPLVDDHNDNKNEEDLSKNLLKKRPKKYHRRVRRQATTNDHNLHKRNPYYRPYYQLQTNYVVPSQVAHQVYYQPIVFQRHPVEGKRQPSISFPTRFDGPVRFPTDENIDNSMFDVQTSAPATQRPPISIWHDSDPNNADFSGFELGTAATNRPAPTSPTNRPLTRPATSRTTTTPPARASGIPPCVWSIVNCCSSSRNVRYSCFESFGCTGAFWDLNPCADTIRQKAFVYVSDYYDAK